MKIRTHIIEEAYKLFVNHGVRTTMDDIAKHMGISKRTIYENFKDKNELLSECAEFYHKQVKEQVDIFFEKADNVLSAILEIITFQRGWEQRKGMKLMIDLKKYYPEVHRNHLIKCRAKGFNDIRSLLKQGVDEGVFRPDLNIELITFMLSEHTVVLSEQFQQFCAENKIKTSVSELDLVHDFFIVHIRGVSTLKGIGIVEDYLKKLDQEKKITQNKFSK